MNITDYKNTIQELLDGDYLEHSVDDIFDYVDNRRKHDIDLYNAVIESYSLFMVNVLDLASNTDKLYAMRQRLIERKQLILADSSYMTRYMAIMKKNEIVAYRTNSSDNNVKPTNDYERRSFVDGRLSGHQAINETLDNHITYLTDSITTISNMIYGIQYVLQLEEYRKLIN